MHCKLYIAVQFILLNQYHNTISSMNTIGKSIWTLNVVLILTSFSGYSQVLDNVVIANNNGLITNSIVLSDSSTIIMPVSKPLYSFLINGKLYNSGEADAEKTDDRYSQIFNNILRVTFIKTEPSDSGWRGEITFENTGTDTVSISNVVPFGEDNSSVYITGRGPQDLARSCLYRPGYQPVRVILPDNAWELGYSSFTAGKRFSVSACTSSEN
jgi:hypothetical protein